MKKWTLRLPDDLAGQVKALANAHHRSVNGEITAVLAASVAREQKSKSKKKGGKAQDA